MKSDRDQQMEVDLHSRGGYFPAEEEVTDCSQSSKAVDNALEAWGAVSEASSRTK